jgi:NADH:ubiquinone oxidoreductase subunit
MGILSFLNRVVTWWNGQTIGTQIFTWRHGVKVGEDESGNIFYRNSDDTKRWVVYNGEAEASRVSPDWHGWLHYTWDEPPTERPVAHKPWEKPHQENLTGTPQAYAPAGSIRRVNPEPRRDYEPWTPE